MILFEYLYRWAGIKFGYEEEGLSIHRTAQICSPSHSAIIGDITGAELVLKQRGAILHD